MEIEMKTGLKLSDFEVWHKPCELCGYDPGKGPSNRCWRCGARLIRDYSERALKKKNEEAS